MIDLITCDFETYYDNIYSLKKLTTEEYIHDRRFQAIGLGIKFNRHKSHWFTGHDIVGALKKVPWDKVALVAHNAKFDAAILSWVYGVKPRFIIDTLSMARPYHNANTGVSLAKLAEHYQLGIKGKEVVQAMGKRAEDFSPEELAQYGEYCKNDCDLTLALLDALLKRGFPLSELQLIDTTIRMYSDPVLTLDAGTIQEEIDLELERKSSLLAMVDQPKGVFSSNPKFAELLISMGVEPPTKPSPKKKNPDGTPLQTYAFAKGDADFIALLDHEDPLVSAAVEVRLGVKSTQRETRAARFMGVHDRCHSYLPVPLAYYAAHTGRYGGDEKINLQNLQRTDKKNPKKGLLRKAIKAKPGHALVVEDLSQIEARLLVWQARQMDRVEAFAQKRDVYSEQASVIYGRKVDRKNNPDDYVMGFIGKCVTLGCLSPQTRVLSNHGWKPIIEITKEDLLWDGEEWVKHLGVVEKGEKEVVRAHGLTATSDHLMLTSSGWRPWNDLIADESLFQSALSLANLPSSTGCDAPHARVGLAGNRWSNAHVVPKELWPEKTLPKVLLRAVGFVGWKQATGLGRNIGDMLKSYPTTRTGHVCLIAFQRSLCAVEKVVSAVRRSIMRCVESEYTPHGLMGYLVGASSFATSSPSMGGMTPNWRSIESKTTGTMNRATFDSLGAARTQKTDDMSENCKSRSMTYDIAYAGPRNRFTVATSVGPVIVHNCGFGLGFSKFGSMIYAGMLGEKGILFDGKYVQDLNVDVDQFEAWFRDSPKFYEPAMERKPMALTVVQWYAHLACSQKIITTFRNSAPKVVEYWGIAGRALDAIFTRADYAFGGPTGALLRVEGDSIILPNGMPIRYEGLERDKEGQYSFLRRKEGRIQRVKTYGGSVVENCTQALARIIITDTMTKVENYNG